MSDQNILDIDRKIRQKFQEDFEALPARQAQLKDLQKSLSSTTLSTRLRNDIEKECVRMSEYIQQVESKSDYNFYLATTIHLIEEYKKLLKVPVRMNFMGRPGKGNKVQRELMSKYLKIAAKYTHINKSSKSKPLKVICSNCLNKKNFDIINQNTYVCMKCFAQQTVIKHSSSYNDIDRVNISSKYMYDRKVHFRDCIKQYQGKQNCTIDQAVYDELAEQFRRHHILTGNKDTPNIERFKNVTKIHILMFLKELGYSNHYENVHLIHSRLTRIKPDDISYLEDHLLNDFDLLTDLYDKRFKHINRKNFINTQYVLYQLLRRHKHKCKKEEFIILKTIDRKFFHDEICQKLFTELGWNHTPFY